MDIYWIHIICSIFYLLLIDIQVMLGFPKAPYPSNYVYFIIKYDFIYCNPQPPLYYWTIFLEVLGERF